jgi:hypothetical protein
MLTSFYTFFFRNAAAKRNNLTGTAGIFPRETS